MFVIGCILMGFFASLVSSMFGGGSGLILMPGIYWLLVHHYGDPGHLMQMSVATCMAMSVPLGIAASIKHYKYGNVDKSLLASTLFPMLFGGLIGAIIVNIVNSDALKVYFSVMILLVAVWVYRHKGDPKNAWHPHKLILKSSSALVGCISTTLGVSVFSVPFLIKLGASIKKAIGTSTIIVCGYTALGAIVLIILGLKVDGLPRSNIGYINMPIFLYGLIPSLIGSIVGAKLVKMLSQGLIKKCFVVMMIISAIVMALPH